MKIFLTIIITAVLTWVASTQFGLESPRIIPQSPNATLPPLEFTMEELEATAFENINMIRKASGRDPLAWSVHLAEKARSHSEWMADTGKYEHSTFGCYENCFWGISISENRLADTIVNNWMGSPPHKDNLLEAEISKCGIGIAFEENTRSHYATFMAY